VITAILWGRLGNQMFQVATAWTLAADNADVAAFDFERARDGPRLKAEVFGAVPAGRAADFRIKRTWGQPSFAYHPIPYAPDLALQGFFQTERYFAHRRAEVLDLFRPRADFAAMADEVIRTLSNDPAEIVTVHVRRGDYLQVTDRHPILPVNYFDDALAIVGSDRPVLVVTDDVEWCRHAFADRRWTVPAIGDVCSLAIMAMAGACVIANSSFSWWGAWLNERPDLCVVAPSPWFGPLGPAGTEDLIPDRWKTVSWT
jgi:hypothetical protein